jgi:hypothetical protein
VQSSAPVNKINSNKAGHAPLSVKKLIDESSSSTDFSQELNIRIPDVETVLPAHFTPPNIMIKQKTLSPNRYHYNQRPATSPMISPKIITIPATSSSSHSSKNNSPIKSAPATPLYYHSPSKSKTATPEKSPIKRSVSSLSPRMIHREVTMLHNLTRSPINSPAKNRRGSLTFEISAEEGTQTSIDYVKYDEMTQTPNGCMRSDEMTQTSMISDVKYVDSYIVDEPQTSSSPNESTHTAYQLQPEIKTWEELGIVDYNTINNLRSGVSKFFIYFKSLDNHID